MGGGLTGVVGGGHGGVHEPLRGQAGRRHGHDRGGQGLRGLRAAYPLGVLRGERRGTRAACGASIYVQTSHFKNNIRSESDIFHSFMMCHFLKQG